LTFGPTRAKSAAWVECECGDRLAQLIVWTSGEAELAVYSRTTDDAHHVNYALTSADELIACLSELTHRLTQPEPTS
jgi:hypothetical protein